MSFRVAGARDCGSVKSEHNMRVLQHFQKDGRRGTFQDDLQRRIFRGRRSTKDMFMREVGRSGADFLRGVTFWSIRSVGLLR